MHTPTSPLELRSFSVQAREPILGMVMDGTIELDLLFNADAVAAQLEISRTPVREALVTLGTMGIVTVKPKRGFTVDSVPPAAMAQWMRMGQYADSQALKQLDYIHLPASKTPKVSRVLDGMSMLQTQHNTVTEELARTPRHQDQLLKADGELHAALIEDAGLKEFFGLQTTIIAVKRRLYHIQHPLSREEQAAILESGIRLAQDILESPSSRLAQVALKTYYSAQLASSRLTAQ